MQICIVQDISFDVLYNMYVLIREYLISMEQGLKGLKYLSIKTGNKAYLFGNENLSDARSAHKSYKS